MSVQYTEEQLLAVEHFKNHRLTVINGPPGSGKTTVMKQLIIPNEETLFCAFTGCAVNRLTLSTGIEAHSISMIGFTNALLERYKHCNIVVDESSMVSVNQVSRLISYLEPKKLAIVGDSKQLPCIEGAPVLNTCLQCTEIDCIQLTSNHRQANLDSGLVKTIRTIGTNEWKGPVCDESLQVVYCASDEDAVEKAAKKFDENSQAVALTKKACDRFNELTENSTNRRVVCTKNLYVDGTLLVANGVTGKLLENGTVEYDNGFTDKKRKSGYMSLFDVARCMTVHKSQGNEFGEDGIILLTSWKGDPPLELMFTALSRFKKNVTIFGTAKMVASALNGRFDSTNVNKKAISALSNESRKRRKTSTQNAKFNV